MRNVQARGKTIELSLDIHSQNDGQQLNELAIYKKILESIVLKSNHLQSFERSLDKTYAFGQSAMFIRLEREDDRTLNKIAVIKLIEDAETYFFDPLSPSRTLHDGMYCGIDKEMKAKELRAIYPKIAFGSDDGVIEVIDYWYKKRVEKQYILLDTGDYKREDLITKDDSHPKKGSPTYKTKKGNHYEVWYKRVAVGIEEPLEKDSKYPTDDLPAIYNYGLTIWTKEGYQSYPYCHSMIDPQRFHNYLASQIATQAKNSTSDKYFVTPDMVKTEKAQQTMREINTIEGAAVIDKTKDGKLPERISPQPVAPGMTEVMEVVKQDIEDSAGIFTENTSMVKQLSGVAFNSMMDVSNMMQNNVIKAHIETIQVVGMLLKQLIPRIYVEPRIVTAADGKVFTINRKMDTGDLDNDISKITDNTDFKITASVSSELQKQLVAEELRQIYNVFPDAIPKTIDLYAKMINTTYSGELSKRMSLLVDPAIEDFASGKITRQQYQQIEQQQEQQAQQAQLAQSNQAMANSPQMQIELEKAQAAKFKAQAEQFKAMTERMRLYLQNEIDKAGLNLDAHKLLSSNELEMEKAGISREQMETDRFKSIMSHLNAELGK